MGSYGWIVGSWGLHFFKAVGGGLIKKQRPRTEEWRVDLTKSEHCTIVAALCVNTCCVCPPLLGPHVPRRDYALVMHECTRHLARLPRDVAKSNVPAELVDLIFYIREHV